MPVEEEPQSLNGDQGLLAVERALGDLRRGYAIAIRAGGQALLIAAVESLQPGVFERLGKMASSRTLVLTRHRARVLGFDTNDVVQIELNPELELNQLHGLAGMSRPGPIVSVAPDTETQRLSGPICLGALQLVKCARLVPAIVALDLACSADPQILCVSLENIERYLNALGTTLRRVSEARVPLQAHAHCELVLFQEIHADAEHVAVVIGNPNPKRPVLVRLHSSCLTGDLLGSLRCDCGEQLRDAVQRIADGGGGVLLYLAQEGRGIGLANKLRAYALQDTGLDTLDADRHLGFESDERSYQVAACMLRELGFCRVRLLTNNPDKMSALREEGLELVARTPLSASVNPHNERYLRTKRERAGHLSEDGALEA